MTDESTTTTTLPPQEEQVHLPRITIKYCTQCKWMLRAAYFAQELLSTFGTDLGEVSLIPSTGGVFAVTIFESSTSPPPLTGLGGGGKVLWDRKRDGGFPEVKVLKSLVRNVIDPSRDLGHTDRALRAVNAPGAPVVGGVDDAGSTPSGEGNRATGEREDCEDCK